MARNLTDKGVAALKPKKSIYHQRDPLMSGHFIRMPPTGSKQFVAMTRNPNGKQVWNTLGTFPLMTIEDARAKAKDIINCLKVGSASRDLRRLRQSQMNGLSAMSKPGGFFRKSHSSQLTQSRFACLGRQKFQIYRAHRCHQALRQG